MPPSSPPDRYGLVGHPVDHSRSPLIHQLFARQTGESLTYELIDALPEDFETAVRATLRAKRGPSDRDCACMRAAAWPSTPRAKCALRLPLELPLGSALGALTSPTWTDVPTWPGPLRAGAVTSRAVITATGPGDA